MLLKATLWSLQGSALFHKVDMGNIYFCSDAYVICSRMDI